MNHLLVSLFAAAASLISSPLQKDEQSRVHDYVMAAMGDFAPPRRWQLHDYEDVAEAIVEATPDHDDQVQLAAIGSFESGFYPKAVGKLGEIGVWQLMPEKGRPTPKTLVGQAREALRRWKAYGRCGYTGETNRKDGTCPLADHRYYRAFFWSYQHPFALFAPAAPVS